MKKRWVIPGGISGGLVSSTGTGVQRKTGEPDLVDRQAIKATHETEEGRL